MDELSILQAVRLKGRAAPGVVAATLGADEATLAQRLADLVATGMLAEGKTVRLTADGRSRLDELLAVERRDIDSAAISAAYSDFRGVNAEFKTLVSDWQLKDGEPNTHADADYDAAVLARVDSVHNTVLPVIASVSQQLPRLAGYADKLSAALQLIKAGDTAWLTRPIADSYHTVWFELHEELLLAAGLTREQEAT